MLTCDPFHRSDWLITLTNTMVFTRTEHSITQQMWPQSPRRRHMFWARFSTPTDLHMDNSTPLLLKAYECTLDVYNFWNKSYFAFELIPDCFTSFRFLRPPILARASLTDIEKTSPSREPPLLLSDRDAAGALVSL